MPFARLIKILLLVYLAGFALFALRSVVQSRDPVTWLFVAVPVGMMLWELRREAHTADAFANALGSVARRLSGVVTREDSLFPRVLLDHVRAGRRASFEAIVDGCTQGKNGPEHERGRLIAEVRLYAPAPAVVAERATWVTSVARFFGQAPAMVDDETLDEALSFTSPGADAWLTPPRRAALRRALACIPGDCALSFSVAARTLRLEVAFTLRNLTPDPSALIAWLELALDELVPTLDGAPVAEPAPETVEPERAVVWQPVVPAAPAPVADEPCAAGAAVNGRRLAHAATCSACALPVRYAAVRCGACGGTLHADCWEERGGCCAGARAA